MAKQTVFHDKDNELKCYINKDNKLYMEIARIDSGDDPLGWGCVVLEKEDVKDLIKVLREIEKQMD